MFNVKMIVSTGLAAVLLNVSILSVPGYTAENTTKVADGVYLFQPGDNYISMFVVTSEGVIAIEPVNTKHAKGFLKAIKSVTDKPVRYLLHSHNHWDHAKGGKVFREVGAKILAHKEAYDWMKANPHPDMALPDEGWDAKRKDIKLGDTTVEMHYVGMSHGLGMTAFRVAQQKVAYVADLVTPNRVLFTIVPDFNPTQWMRALREIERLDFDKAVFSHTQAKSPIGSKTDVTKTREYIQDLRAAIVAEFKKGTSFQKLPQMVKLPKYENWAMYKQWLPMNVLRMALDMHMGPFPWRPAKDYEN